MFIRLSLLPRLNIECPRWLDFVLFFQAAIRRCEDDQSASASSVAGSGGSVGGSRKVGSGAQPVEDDETPAISLTLNYKKLKQVCLAAEIRIRFFFLSPSLFLSLRLAPAGTVFNV